MPMVLEVPQDLETRLVLESEVSHKTPAYLLQAALDKYLEDQEDVREATRVLAEVEAGRMKVYSLEEVERKLDALDAVES